MLNGNEAAQRREAVVMHSYTDERRTYKGDDIYSVTDKGIVISVGQSKLFLPWNRVTLFTYHNEDVAARNVIQGY